MNKNFILKSGSILAFVLPISLISMQIKSNNLNTKYKLVINKTKKTINRFFKTQEKFNYIKEINNNYLYIQFKIYYAIVDKNNFEIIEIKKGYHTSNENLIYSFPNFNEKNENKISTYSKNKYSPIDEDKLDTLPNISNLVKDAWWWASRNTSQKVGYTDQDDLFDKYDNSGLCEYIAMSNILLYNHLFKNSNIFTNEEFNEYFEYNNYDNSLINASPTFKYYQYNEPNKSLVANLWRLNKRWVNFYAYSSYKYPINKFIKNKEAFNTYEYDYKGGAYYWRTTQNINNNNPVIVSTTKTMHSFIIYGYDEQTKMVLLNWLWGDNDSIVLVNYWKLAAAGSALKIMFTMRPKSNSNLNTNKLFKYNGEMYTGEEIRKLLNE